MTRISEFWTEGKWDTSKIQLLHGQAGMPQETIEEILDTPILQGEKDCPRWDLSSNGNFTVASAWEASRTRHNHIRLFEEIWNDCIPPSTSVFLWRLLSNKIPVDVKLQWRNITLASKCRCCTSRPQVESNLHLFIRSEAADIIWNTFDSWFGPIPEGLRRTDSIPERLGSWAARCRQSSKKHICRLIPCLILWYIWTERNNSIHNGDSFRPQYVVWQVNMYLWKGVHSAKIKPAQWQGCSPSASFMVSGTLTSFRTRNPPIKWEPPDPLWLKLNSNGAYDEESGKAGGGEIVRDHKGELLIAYSCPLKAKSKVEAEVLAIDFGLNSASSFGKPIWIESQSATVISLLHSGEFGPAEVRHAMSKIKGTLKNIRTRASHTPHEGNKIAALLSKSGLTKEEAAIIGADNASRILRAHVRLEQLGYPHFRKRGDGNEPGWPAWTRDS